MTIPVLDQRPELLRKAVKSCLDQIEPVEIVVVDDGCRPELAPRAVLTPEMLSAVRLIEHGENRGIAAALNTGIAASTAPWWCWLSSDDEFAPEKVKVQKLTLDAAGGFASFHAYWKIDHQAQSKGLSATPLWTSHRHQKRMLTRDCWINGSTVMVHKKVIDAVGDFDTSYRYGQDWEWFCRVGEKYRWIAVPCGLCRGPEKQPGCPRCYGFGAWPLGTRHMAGNLTARIEANPEMRAARDAEDRRIRDRYRVAPEAE